MIVAQHRNDSSLFRGISSIQFFDPLRIGCGRRGAAPVVSPKAFREAVVALNAALGAPRADGRWRIANKAYHRH